MHKSGILNAFYVLLAFIYTTGLYDLVLSFGCDSRLPIQNFKIRALTFEIE